MTKPAGEKVPKQMQSKFEEITALTDAFCDKHLNAEYADMSRQLTAALCRKRPSPLVKGQAKSWACGIIHALGMVNFLYDPSQTPHMKATELYKHFGVGQSTGQGKSKQIRDMMKMHQMDPNWCLPSKMEDNPLIWMVSVNGFIIDIRQAPREIQEEAFRKGIIPYLPEEKVSDQSELKESIVMTELDEQDERIEAILGENESLSFDESVEKFYDYLTKFLQLPCDVTGIEDFQWEEYYVLGPGSPQKYQELRQAQPSYQDTFELLAIEKDVYSEWMMYHGEDLAGQVRRKSDGQEFYLGLVEIKAVDEESLNYQLLDDYAVWFVNNR